MKTAGMTGLVASLALAVASAGAQSKEFKIDAAHSDANFAIKHMAISTVHGSIRGVSGVIQFDPADLSKSSVEAAIDVSKVDTGVAQRDTHLKSPDFFDVAKFPTMTFKSTSIAKAAGGFAVTGNLTMHGVTKQVVLALEAPGKAEPDAKGAVHRGFTATTTLNRKDFGLVWSNKTPGGDAIVGDDVKIELDIEAVAAS